MKKKIIPVSRGKKIVSIMGDGIENTIGKTVENRTIVPELDIDNMNDLERQEIVIQEQSA